MKRTSAKPIALGGMLAALALAIMCLGGLIPVATYINPMVCCMICAVVVRYCGRRLAWAWYAAVAILSLLIAPDMEAKGLFLILGYYPIVKPLLDRTRPKLLWKHLLFNALILAMYSVLFYAMGIDQVLSEFQELGFIGFGLLLIGGNICFYLLDQILERRFLKK